MARNTETNYLDEYCDILEVQVVIKRQFILHDKGRVEVVKTSCNKRSKCGVEYCHFINPRKLGWKEQEPHKVRTDRLSVFP